MAINAIQLLTYVIRPVLTHLDMRSVDAENLLLGTCAQESQMGQYLHQVNGPALGIYQMESETHESLWDNYINYRPPLRDKVNDFVTTFDHKVDLIGNLYYATAMARIKYASISEPIPDSSDVEALGQYWKKYYNTEKGRGTVQEFVLNYKRYVG